MKHRILLIVTSLLFFTGYAQQFPIQSQYQFNYSSINPASVGENSYYSARLSMRNQWVGFTENPISLQLMTVTKGIGKSGLGVTVFNDKTGGAFNKSGLSLSYSHKVQFSGSELFLGLSAGGAKINFDATAALDLSFFFATYAALPAVSAITTSFNLCFLMKLLV